jgi:hypothetical protein
MPASVEGPVSAEERERPFAEGQVDCIPMSLQSFVARHASLPHGRAIALLFGAHRGPDPAQFGTDFARDPLLTCSAEQRRLYWMPMIHT